MSKVRTLADCRARLRYPEVEVEIPELDGEKVIIRKASALKAQEIREYFNGHKDDLKVIDLASMLAPVVFDRDGNTFEPELLAELTDETLQKLMETYGTVNGLSVTARAALEKNSATRDGESFSESPTPSDTPIPTSSLSN